MKGKALASATLTTALIVIAVHTATWIVIGGPFGVPSEPVLDLVLAVILCGCLANWAVLAAWNFRAFLARREQDDPELAGPRPARANSVIMSGGQVRYVPKLAAQYPGLGHSVIKIKGQLVKVPPPPPGSHYCRALAYKPGNARLAEGEWADCRFCNPELW